MARSIATLSDVPQHTTDIRQLQSLLQELMMAYSIGGVCELLSHDVCLILRPTTGHGMGMRPDHLQCGDMHTYSTLVTGSAN